MCYQNHLSVFAFLCTVTTAVCPAEADYRAVESDQATPSSTSRAERAAIEAFCNALVPMTKRGAGHMFGLTPGPGAGTEPVWRQYGDSKELENAIRKNEIPQKARVWRGKNGATAVQMVENPISGDWSQAVDYCFRSDGSLARLESTLITFDTADNRDEGVERLRVRYFDKKGRELAEREEVRNAKSRLPAKRVFEDKTETIYRAVRDLPFAELLSK